MTKYNELCDWIENNLGTANIKISGKSVGQGAYQGLIENKMISDDDKPIKVMEALAVLASMVIKDFKTVAIKHKNTN